MEQNNFILDLIASLLQSKSKKQIQEDIKNMGDIKFPLVGTLSPKTKAQLKKDIASLNGTVNLTGKIDNKGVATSVQQATTQAQKQVDSKPIDVSFSVKKDKLLNDIKLLAQQNSRLFKDNSMAVKYNSLLDSAEMARNTVELSTLRTQLGSFRSELKVTGNAGLTMTDALKNGFSKVLQLFGGHGIIKQFTAQLRNAWTEAKELDKSMTDLSRVSESLTRSGFPEYLDRVISKTKQLAVATKDYIDSVTTFSRAGYNLADSETLASAAIQLEKVGDMSAVDASKALLAGLQGYTEIDGYGMDQLIEKAQALNDKIDVIGNTASISQKEVAQGIQAVGSVMSDANTSVDEFIALLGAGNRAVQDSDKVALAIRTSALRIRGCSAELEEMGEETDNVYTSVSKLAEKIEGLTNINGSGGVKILEADEETFRSIYDIYNDISKVYDKMSDKDASALLDLIAGKNRSNQISAILQNMSEANVLLERSLNAAGTASEEYEIYLNSAEAASERFGVAMTEAYNSIINGETVKGLTNAGTAVLDFANSWNILEGTLKGFLALGVLKGVTTLTVAFKNSAVQVSNYGNALNAVKDMSDFAEGTTQYADALKKLKNSCITLTDVQLKQVLANKGLSDSQLIQILQLKDLEVEDQKARLAQLGLIQTTETQAVAQGAATASTFSLSAAMKGLGVSIKTAIMANPVGIAIMAISTAIGVATSVISKYNQQLEEARQKAVDLTNSYKEQRDSLNSQIEKYKELKETLDNGNLSTDETRSIKEQLLEIQKSLIDSYGNEASNIDLVNGKYREQLGLLSELSKEKATDYVAENRDVFEDAKKELEKIRTYDIGTVSWNSYAPETEDQKKLIEYLETYSDLLDLTYSGAKGRGVAGASVNLSVKADVENADELMHQLAEDLERYGKDNNIDVSGLLEGISGQLKKTWTDKLTEYKTVYDEFMKAEIVRNDTLRPLYQQSIQAVEDYNNALSSGEGVAEAKTNLDSVQQSVQNATGELEGSQEVFDGIYDGINKSAESAYNLTQSFENDESVKGYAEQLKGLTDIDLKAINFEDNVQSSGEEAFGALIDILGLSEDKVQNLIDKLVELGYVQGEVQSSTSNFENPILSFEDAWADSFTSENEAVKELGNTLLDLAEQGRLTKETFNEADSTEYFKNFNISADEAVMKINKLVDESKQLSSMSSQISSMAEALGTKQENGFVEADTLAGFDVEVRGLESWDRFQEVLGSTASSYEECQEAANALATEWVNSSDFLAQLTEQNEEYYKTQLESMGIENYEEVISYAHALNEAKEVLSQSSLILGEATQDEIEALIAEGQYSELTANMILALYDAKIAEQAAALDTSADCANLIALAGDADRTSQSIQLLIQLMEIYSGLESGVYDNNEFARTGALAAVTGIKAQLEAIANGETAKMEIEPTVKLGNRGKSSAKSAGKEAGKSYKDGLKEELSDLESIISSLSKSIDGQKEVITSQKEVALESIESQIDALEEERDARLAVIDAQKKQLEEQIKAIEKQIKAKNDEIKAINDAATARQHEIDLQKAQYELERMQNQRTMLQYSEEKGMHYVADESGIRDAREDVDDAKRQLKIDAIEREIDLLENKKDLLNEQIDLLDEQADNINKYYDSQIKSLEKQKESTEKYFESLINSIENSKSKYQELLDIVDKAELSGKLKQLGIDEEALLNGSEEEFEKLKNAYLDVVFQVNEGNEEMLSSLRELSGYEGTAPAVLTDTSEKLDDMNTKLDGASESMESLASSATTASEGASSIAASMGELGTNTEGISDNLTSINDALTGLPEAENINAVSDAFTNMGEAIKSVADALGVGEEGTVGGLVGALQSLSEISLGEMGGEGQGGGTGIVSQFQALKTAVDDVTNAISGGGSSGSTGGGDASNSSSPSMSAGAGGEGASGLVGAIESFKSATDEALGSGGEEGEGSDGGGSGAIGQFGQLKEAVDEVTTAIGSGDSEGGSGDGGDEEAANLIGAINNLGETTEEILAGGSESGGESGGVIGRFEEFKDVIGEANEHVTGISEGLAAIDGQEVECTIKVNIETTGGLPAGLAHSTGTALDTMKLESAEYNAKYLGNAHVEGTALTSGDWAVQSDEQSALVGELGYEIVVRNGRFFTVGNAGPEMFPIKKGDIVFNHEQSVELLKNGRTSGRGKAYADGTVGGGKVLTKNGAILRPLQPGDKMYDMVQKFDAYFKSMDGNLEKLVPNSFYEHQKQMEDMAKQINYVSSVTNNNRNMQPVVNHINVTCPGVTSQQVAEQLGGVLGKELDKQFNGFNNYVDQQSRIR